MWADEAKGLWCVTQDEGPVAALLAMPVCFDRCDLKNGAMTLLSPVEYHGVRPIESPPIMWQQPDPLMLRATNISRCVLDLIDPYQTTPSGDQTA
ncbi:MAG: hypothetical protein NVS4B8_14240 [Herpetosiphon sp.]